MAGAHRSYQKFPVHFDYNLLQTFVFLCSSAYEDRPDEGKSLGQWWGMTILSAVFFAITVVAATGDYNVGKQNSTTRNNEKQLIKLLSNSLSDNILKKINSTLNDN